MNFIRTFRPPNTFTVEVAAISLLVEADHIIVVRRQRAHQRDMLPDAVFVTA
jgi:hypothetical protein